MRNHKQKQSGFTLIELLIVIVIIGILAVVIFVAVDPAKRFADARNARRFAEVNSILEAILKYQVDNRGLLPNRNGISVIDSNPATSQIIGTDGNGCDAVLCAPAGVTVGQCADLGDGVLVGDYLAAMPVDPLVGSATKTMYYINKTAAGRIKVGACGAENAVTISVQR